jgi:hypothetical protein
MPYEIVRYNERMSGKVFDFLILIALAVFASAVSLIFQLPFLYSTLFFLGVPLLYLALRSRRRTQWRRIGTMTLLFGGWYGFLLAYLADWNHVWAWPKESLPWGTWFSIVNPVELLWLVLWVAFVLLFYEHFIERDRARAVSRRVWWAIAPAPFVTAFIFVATTQYPALITWPYAYAVILVLTLPPAMFLIYRNPHILLKLLIPALFFVPFHVAHEVVSTLLGQWYFPGQYIAVIPLPGGTLVPIEETIVWIVLGSVLTLAYYELYVDDGR